MGGSSLLFNPSHGIRLRAQPTAPLRLRTGPSSCCPYGRVIEIDRHVQRFLAIRAEAKKGVQSGRKFKKNPGLNSNSKSKNSADNSEWEQIVSFLNKIGDSIKSPSAVEPNGRSMGEQKKQPLEPKSKDKKAFSGHIKSSGPPSSFDILTRDDGNRAVAPPRDITNPLGSLSDFAKLARDEGKKAVAPLRDIKKSSGPPSNFDKSTRDDGNNAFAFLFNDKKSSGAPSNFDILIRDDSNNAVSPPRDYKPSRPTSRFVRRSPIPISNPAKEETETIPKEDLPSVIVKEALEQEMSGSDEMPVIMEKEEPLKSELESEPTAELEAMTLSKLRDIAKARGLKSYSKVKKAKLVEILKGTPL